MRKKPIQRAFEAVGGINAMARLLGIAPPSVHGWVKTKVPAERCPQIERLTEGAVLCEELRPDVDWAVVRGRKRQKRAAATV